MSAFARYIGIDYSGAETPSSSLKGLRVYAADGAAEAAFRQADKDYRRNGGGIEPRIAEQA